MTKKKNQKKTSQAVADEIICLPQNIIKMGEHVEEDKNIYISQSTYKKIHEFTKDKTLNESGGVLVGDVINEFGKTNIIISEFVEAKYSEGTPTTLTFTHESWDYIHSQINTKCPKKKIIGWIHTHPNFGIFLSEYDKFIQENFFKAEYDVAYVVDPIQNIEGFYFWINGKIERCKGFFVFDETGKTIDISKEEESEEKKVASSPSLLIGLNISLAIAFFIMMFVLVSAKKDIRLLSSELDSLHTQQLKIVDQVNGIINNLRQNISDVSDEADLLGVEYDGLKEDIFSIQTDVETLIQAFEEMRTEADTEDMLTTDEEGEKDSLEVEKDNIDDDVDAIFEEQSEGGEEEETKDESGDRT